MKLASDLSSFMVKVSSGNHIHFFVNDLLGERRPISQAQYNDENLTQPS
jgi:hypothetical protein